MPERLNLTSAVARAIEPPAKGRRTVYDRTVPQLCVRVTATGARAWYVVAKDATNKVQWVRIGDAEGIGHDVARRLAKERLGAIAAGERPNAAKAAARKVATVGRVPLAAVWERHRTDLEAKERTAGHVAEIGRVVAAAVGAGITDLAAKDVAPRLAALLDGMQCAPSTRRRFVAHLRALAQTAMDWWEEDLPRDPLRRLERGEVPTPAPPVFTPAEAVRLVADESLTSDWGRLFAFLLLTGCRFKEGAWARWSRIDLAGGIYHVAAPDEDERAQGYAVKRNKSRDVPLGPELLALVKEWPDEDDFLFPESCRPRAHIIAVRAFRRHLQDLEIPLAGRRIHALRHTFATLMLAAGEDSAALRLTMGHAGEELTVHYARTAMRWRALLSSWNGVLRLRDAREVARLCGDAPTAEAL